MAVEAVTCNDQANEALAAATLQALVTTNGLTPAEQATVDVKVVSCEVSGLLCLYVLMYAQRGDVQGLLLAFGVTASC